MSLATLSNSGPLSPLPYLTSFFLGSTSLGIIVNICLSCLLDSKHLERWGCILLSSSIPCPRSLGQSVLTHYCCVHWWIHLGTLHVLTALQSQGLLAPRLSPSSFLTPVPLHVLWSASSQWAAGSFVSPSLCIGFLLRWWPSPTKCNKLPPSLFFSSSVSSISLAAPPHLHSVGTHSPLL